MKRVPGLDGLRAVSILLVLCGPLDDTHGFYSSPALWGRLEDIAIRSLTDFLERQDLRGLSFLDIGCGSGLFSLAAVRLGAQKIVSMDVDPFSYDCAQGLRQTVGSPSSWQIICGSILDNNCVS